MYTIYLIFLELITFYILFFKIKTSVVLAYLFAFCFVIVFSLLFSSRAKKNLFLRIVLLHCFIVSLFLIWKFYNTKPIMGTDISTNSQNFLNTILLDTKLPEKDKLPFLYVFTYTSLLQYKEADNNLMLLTDAPYKKKLTIWLHNKAAQFNSLMNNITKHYPALVKLPLYIQSGEYDIACSKMLVVLGSQKFTKFQNMVSQASTLRNSQQKMEESIMNLHKAFIMYAKSDAFSTIFLLPGTFSYIPELLTRIAQSPFILSIDFYYLDINLQKLKEYNTILLRNMNIPVLLKDPITNTLWGINSSINGKNYQLIKILDNSVVEYKKGTQGIVHPSKNIKRFIERNINLVTSCFYYKWFTEPYKQEYFYFYKDYIKPIYKVWIDCILGSLIIVCLVFITQRALQFNLYKDLNLSGYFILSVLLILLCYMYFEMTIFTIEHITPYILKFL